MCLKKIDIKNYNNNGFLEIKNFFPQKIIKEIRNQLSKIIMDVCIDMKIPYRSDKFDYLINKILPIIYKKNKKKGSYIFDVSSRLNIFKNLTNYEKSINVISKLLGIKREEIISAKFSLFLFTKYHKSHAIGWHQESGYYSDLNFKEFQFLKKENSLFTWIPLTPTSHGNGALLLMPKSHLEKKVIHKPNLFSDRYKKSWDKRGELYIDNIYNMKKKYKEKEISSKPKDIIFVNSNTLHKSGLNKYNKTRVGVIMRFGERFENSKFK